MFWLDGADALFLLISPVCALVFTLVCLSFMYVDLYGKPSCIARRRVQGHTLPPTLEEYNTLWRVVLCQNGLVAFVLCPPLTLLAYRYLEVQPTFPGIPQMCLEVVVMSMVYDIWFWAFHRLFHLPMFYHLHKLHHQWKAPCAFEGAYFDVFDFVVGNYGPMLFLPPLVSSHYYSILIFGCLGVTSVACTHSGYDLRDPFLFLGPLKPSVRHDAHHEFFSVNFSTFGMLDALTGTYLSEEAAAIKRKKANT